MRVLMFFPSLGRGGTEEQALEVSVAGARAGRELVLCFPNTVDTASVLTDARAAGLGYVPWPLGKRGAGVRNDYGTVEEQRAEMARTLAEVRPDAVCMMVPWPDSCLGAILACGAAGVPTVPVFCLVRDVCSIPPELQARCAEARTRNQRWVAVSADNRALLMKLFGSDDADEIAVVHNGVDMPEPWRDPSPEQIAGTRHALRDSLGLPSTARIALTVARLAPVKGHRDLLTAAHAQHGSDLHYVWVGDGPLAAELASTAERLGLASRVHQLGYRRDIPALLHAADLFVFPTHGEGCSRALIEAMAAGLPVITADASSNSELITHGQHGLLYPTGDAAALADRLGAATRDPAAMRRMAAAARDRARRQFTAAAMRDGTYRVLDEVVANQQLFGSASGSASAAEARQAVQTVQIVQTQGT